MKKGMVFLTIVFLAVTMAMPVWGAEQIKPAMQQLPAKAITETINITCPATVQVNDGGRIPIIPTGWQMGTHTNPEVRTYSFRNAEISQNAQKTLICYYETGNGIFVVSINQVKHGYSCQVMPSKNGFVCRLNN